MYHLNNLIADKYIKKVENLYSLTSKGKRYLSGISLATGQQIRLPRAQTMIFCRNRKGEILLYKWTRQPFLGHVSLPFNRLRFGQFVSDAAKETIKFKTNLNGDLKYAGDVYVVAKKNEEILTHYLAHIFILKNQTGEVYADGLTGKPFWGKINDFDTSDLVYGTKEIIHIIETKKPPFFEEILIEKS